MAAPLFLRLRPLFKRGRPYNSLFAFVKRIERDKGYKIEILNDRLLKIDDKYFFSQYPEDTVLRSSKLDIVEATVLGPAIICHLVDKKYFLAHLGRNDDLDINKIEISFAFDSNGDFVDKKVLSKLGMAGLINEYKIFTHFTH